LILVTGPKRNNHVKVFVLIPVNRWHRQFVYSELCRQDVSIDGAWQLGGVEPEERGPLGFLLQVAIGETHDDVTAVDRLVKMEIV
jgi:hypothetical protein